MPRSVLRLGSRKAETEKGLGSDVIFLLKALVKCLQVWCADSCGERWTGRDREWRLDVVGAVGGAEGRHSCAPAYQESSRCQLVGKESDGGSSVQLCLSWLRPEPWQGRTMRPRAREH